MNNGIYKKYLFLALILFGIFLLPKISWAATINAVSCSQVDVQAAINSAPPSGVTVS